MYDCGCRWILFGVESGSPEILKKVDKRIPYEKIEETFRNCSKLGIVSIASFIIGFPGETVQRLRESVELMLRVRATLISVNHLLPD